MRSVALEIQAVLRLPMPMPRSTPVSAREQVRALVCASPMQSKGSSLRMRKAGHQGLSWPVAGRLEGAEERSGEVGMRAAHASLTDWPHLFECSGRRSRSELCGPTSS
jgi:hypothetical protein